MVLARAVRRLMDTDTTLSLPMATSTATVKLRAKAKAATTDLRFTPKATLGVSHKNRLRSAQIWKLRAKFQACLTTTIARIMPGK